MVNRLNPRASPKLALTDTEIHLLNSLSQKKDTKELSGYLIQIARLGGYLARKSDPPPGNTVMWRGLTRLMDIQLGFSAGAKVVGN